MILAVLGDAIFKRSRDPWRFVAHLFGNVMQQDFEPTAAIAPEPAAPAPEFLHVGRGDDMRKIVVRRRSGATPGLLWLGGLKAGKGGNNAAALGRWARAPQRHFVALDYSGPVGTERKF